MKCRHCGFENPPGFAFCGKCGSSLSSNCPQCGFENPQGFAFCGKCGAPLESTEDRFTPADLDHLRAYLPSMLIEGLRLGLSYPTPGLLDQCITHLSRLLETIYTHLPAYVVESVLHDPTPGRVNGKFIDGTLLFADISGFTAMSERFSRIGLEGAEEITAIVNRYFSAMLSILREHHGQLVKFGGDALLGLFLEPDSATRAVQTALSMQTMMSAFAEIETSQGVFPLLMKAGIHKGRFFSAQLGTSDRMEYALFGPDVNAAAATESAAVGGQVLTNWETYQAITSPCRVTRSSSDSPYLIVEEIQPGPLVAPPSVLPPPQLTEPTLDNLRRGVELLDALTPFLPAGLLARIASEPAAGRPIRDEWGTELAARSISLEGEHRLVAVLFANPMGLGEIVHRLGPGREEQILVGLNHYFIAMREAISRFGGVINKMDIYNRGDKLLALFGAPLAHEDDAERAVRAALAMQETLSEINCSLPTNIGLPDLCLEQQVGITFGYVFAGYVGTGWRHEYTVMGDEVNLAARLMAAADPGAVIVSSDIRRKVRALFELDPRGEVELRGKTGLIPIFSISGTRSVPEPLRGLKGMRSPLVGREEEWRLLVAAAEQLFSERGQIVCVTGEAGLGKSRLVAELRQASDSQALRWIEGRCLSYTESVSFRPFHEITQQLVGIQPDDGEAEAWNKLRAEVSKKLSSEDVPLTLPYLANFLNLHIEDSEKVRYLDAEALQQRTFIAISTLIEAQASAHSPLILILEDIHWIDQASLALLEYLMPLVNRVPLMLLMVYRPERTKRCWQVHEKAMREYAHCATEIAIHPLAPDDSQQLLINLVGIEQWPIEMHNLILNRAEGNPLYLEEVIRTLIESRVLTQEDGEEWQIGGELASIQVPDTLQGVMMARLDRLEEPCRWTAQYASVIGRVFPFDVLSHIVPENGSQLNRCLVRLQQHETVRETQRAPELVYTFKHAMMQEVCYHSLLTQTRRLFHRKIAAHLEENRAIGRRDAESNYPLIAHHAFLGQDWPRALQYQLLTGQQAKKLFANHEAIDHFEKALNAAEQLPPDETTTQRQAIHAALGELLTNTGQYEHALEHLEEALALAKAHDDRDAQALVCRWLARLHELRGEYPRAFDWIEQGLTALDGRETAEAAQLLFFVSLIHSRQGDYDNALEQCQTGLRIAQELGEVTALARAHNMLGIIRLRDNSAMATEHFRQAFTLYERAGHIQGQAISHNLIANAHFDLGQWKAANEHYCQARELFDQIGDVYNRVFAENNLGGIARLQGRLDEALSFYQSALQSLEQIGGSTYVLGVIQMNLGATFIRRGETDAAFQHLHTSLDNYRQAQSRDFLPEVYRHLAEATLMANELPQAEKHGQQALSLARELSMRSEEGNSLRALGEVAIAKGLLNEAETYFSESLSILEEVGDEYEWARSQLSMARLYHLQAKDEQGIASLDRCMDVFQRLDAELDLATASTLREQMAPG